MRGRTDPGREGTRGPLSPSFQARRRPKSGNPDQTPARLTPRTPGGARAADPAAYLPRDQTRASGAKRPGPSPAGAMVPNTIDPRFARTDKLPHLVAPGTNGARRDVRVTPSFQTSNTPPSPVQDPNRSSARCGMVVA